MKIFGFLRKKKKPLPRVYSRQTSLLCTLMRIERDAPNACRTWRAIPFYDKQDIVITCDRLGHKAFRGNPLATHRVSALAVSRIANSSGRYKVKKLFMGDFDMIGTYYGASNPDQFAEKVTDMVAKLLLRKHYPEIDWLDFFVVGLRYYLGASHAPHRAGNGIEQS